ncbi:uncharacterized protein J3R85_008921 [Psidium guajava]|nr:uncharacterized protein J3R85_008921 [Psidium guajava]
MGGDNVTVRDATVHDLVEWLVKRKEWGIMGGKDQYLVVGRTAWDFRCLTDKDSDWGNKLLLLAAVRNMLALVIESSMWDSNDFAIPYPTYFHPKKDRNVLAWQGRMRKSERK